MCVIAGYTGNRPAAPILIEMLRRQQHFDGSLSTGIATIHEGKLYWKKVLGDVDEFLKQIDLNELPGTIGIAHSRPDNNYWEFAHPYVSNNGKIAVVSNGTTARDYRNEKRSQIAKQLAAEGYSFPIEVITDNPNTPTLGNGKGVSMGDVIVNRVDSHIQKGLGFEPALAAAASELFGERVSVAINADAPDRICVARQTRPMEALIGNGECYIATSRFGFPEDAKGTVMTLPTLRICNIQKDGVHITSHAIEGEMVDGVCEITPMTHIKAYEMIEAFLQGKKENPANLDEVYFMLKKHPEIFCRKYDYAQFAKVIYDILYELKREGRLQTEVRPHMTYSGIRNCVMMWLD